MKASYIHLSVLLASLAGVPEASIIEQNKSQTNDHLTFTDSSEIEEGDFLTAHSPDTKVPFRPVRLM